MALAQERFTRLNRDQAGKPKALQTAIVRYQAGDATVDLVSVVHIGDKGYYQKLDKRLGEYQAVLFEMVLDVPQSVLHQNRMRQLIGREQKPLEIDTSKGGNDPLSLFQQKLADILGLEFQLPLITYNRKGFYHADLTLKEFEKAMAAKKQSPTSILKSFLKDAGKTSDTPEGKAMAKLSLLKIAALGPTPAERKILKTGLAAEFSDLDSELTGMEGEALLLTRNNRALQVFRDRVKRGDRKLAIFYGAAHMPDLGKKLRRQGWKPISTTWLDAWKL